MMTPRTIVHVHTELPQFEFNLWLRRVLGDMRLTVERIEAIKLDLPRTVRRSITRVIGLDLRLMGNPKGGDVLIYRTPTKASNQPPRAPRVRPPEAYLTDALNLQPDSFTPMFDRAATEPMLLEAEPATVPASRPMGRLALLSIMTGMLGTVASVPAPSAPPEFEPSHEPPPQPPLVPTVDIDTLGRDKLRPIAKQLGIVGFGQMSTLALRAAIRQARG